MFKKLKLAFNMFKLVFRGEENIFTLALVLNTYVNAISKKFDPESHIGLGLYNCKCKLPLLDQTKPREENQKCLNSITESIRKHGLDWIN